MSERKATKEYPGRLAINPSWVLASVFGLLVASVATLLRKFIDQPDAFELTPLGETAVTYFTGIWFWVRYHYTESIISARPSFVSYFSTSIIGLVGLLSFVLAGYPIWFLGHALVLLLAIEKNLEIILYQRRKQTDESENFVWRARLLVLHHWYSVVRDLSMSAWWLLYGAVRIWFGVPDAHAILLFGIPYVVLVFLWCSIKVRTYHVESAPG